jgi:hypothetical protein
VRNNSAACRSLDEEKATDKKLTALAESKINLRAASFEGQNLSQNVALTVSARCFASGDPQVES